MFAKMASFMFLMEYVAVTTRKIAFFCEQLSKIVPCTFTVHYFYLQKNSDLENTVKSVDIPRILKDWNTNTKLEK